MVGILASTLLNLLVILVLQRKRKSMTNMDRLMISLSVSDLLQALVGYTTGLYNEYWEGSRYRDNFIFPVGTHRFFIRIT